jgi:hypothetical protein
MTERKSSSQLQEHMLWTYYGLRVGLAAIGISLPLLLIVAGSVLHGASLQPSISDYYNTVPKLKWLTTRDIFVGGLLAASACLYLYKGYSNKENIALNCAGVFAVFVALFPTAAKGQPTGSVSKLHAASAVLFFLSIAYVSLFRSRDTLRLVSPASAKRYGRLYTVTGGAMIVSPLVAVALSYRPEPAQESSLIFWIETLGVWSFAAYWIVKTSEMRQSLAERRGLDAELKRETVPADAGVTAAPVKALKRNAVERVVPAN